MNIKHAIAAAILALSTIMSGCSTLAGLSGLEAPQVNLVDIQMRQATLFEQTFEVQLRVKNPNNKPLPISGMNYNLHINGMKFADGSNAKNIAIPALSDTVIPVTLSTSSLAWLRIANNLKDFTGKNIKYAVSGSLFLDGLIPRLPFAKDGEVAIDKLLPQPQQQSR